MLLGCVLLAGALTVWHLAHREPEGAQSRVNGDPLGHEQQLSGTVAWMDRVLDDAARRVSVAHVPDKAEDEERALLDAMQPALRAPGVHPQATLALYDRHARDVPLVGRVTAAEVVLHPGAASREGLTAATVERLAPASSETGWAVPGVPWLWFEPAGPQAVRLVRAVVLHEFLVVEEEGDSEPALAEGVYLLTVEAPLDLPGAVSVRCDVVDGAIRDEALTVDLSRRHPDLTQFVERFDPRRSPWRFPGAPAGARARHYLPAPEPSDPWWMYAAAFLVSCVAMFASWRKSSPAPAKAPDVTAEAAHEMRTPLTAMRGALEVALRRERTAKEYQETLHLCLEEVRGLQNLQDAVLFLGRGARTEPAKEAVDLGALVEAEVARVKAAHAERTLSYDGPAQALSLVGDPSLLARLIGNLLDNAALHSVPGGAIRAALTKEKGHAVLTVEDDGPGVPAERRERIFERFFRGPEAARRGIPGSGLGLPIARWLAEVHGGTLELDPEPTDRARFRLRLPLR
jgi:hypothetical protein